jgi:hypothetical protein
MSSAKSVTALRSQKTEGWSDRLIALLATIGSVGQVQTSTAVFLSQWPVRGGGSRILPRP